MPGWLSVVEGAIIVLFAMFLPGGLASLPARWRTWRAWGHVLPAGAGLPRPSPATAAEAAAGSPAAGEPGHGTRPAGPTGRSTWTGGDEPAPRLAGPEGGSPDVPPRR
ncbi:hypothetical protein [Thermaerobacter subterraneus]|uniref:hypothetical protein n=1 Tax=Thermaerobacter subterraneus TaxID=175696 RepID=UPI0012EAB504|nr:hypothetical protein [Thermaerobacter subterraneus]